jgi:hypothetical protein
VIELADRLTRRDLASRALAALGYAIGVAAVMPTERALAEAPPPIPHVPLSFGVAEDGGTNVADADWLAAQLDAAEAILGPLGVHLDSVGTRKIPAAPAHVETREDRDALAHEVRPGVVNVFVVGTLRDVDDPLRLRRGVHWRERAHPSTRYVILSAEAMPGVLGHELGHYFGLLHSSTADNLMSYVRSGGDVFLDDAQAKVVQASARRAFASGELVPTRSVR